MGGGGYDVKFILDDSLSTMMLDALNLLDPKNSPITRSQAIVDATAFMGEFVNKIDRDGVQIRFYNHPVEYQVAPGEDIRKYLEYGFPMGMGTGGDTPTCTIIRAEKEAYMKRYLANPAATKKMIYMFLTDGESTDGIDPVTGKRTVLKTVLTEFATELNNAGAPLDQVGFQFFQVGADETARAELTEIDDMKVGGRDIADTTLAHPSIPLHILTLKAVAGPVCKDLDDERTMINLAKMVHAYEAKKAASGAGTEAVVTV